MKNIIIDDKQYELIENYKDAFNEEELKEKLTDYFDEYDYVLGDYSYDKLRLKGFYSNDNKKCNEINDYSKYKEYLKNYCSYECRYFVIKKKN